MTNTRPFGSIYLATCLVNQKLYVGQTVKAPKKRWAEYRVEVRSSNRPFCNAIKKYGWENFSWVVIDTAANIDELNLKEVDWISKLGTLVPNGYNLSAGGGNTTGVTHSPETRAKMSKSHLGKKMSETTKQRMRLAKQGSRPSVEAIEKARLVTLGRKDSEETRLKKILSSTGRKHTPEARLKISASGQGRRHSPEHKEKNRVAHLRENWSPESLEKCRQAGLSISDERREALRVSRLGSKSLPETKRKASTGMKEAWARGDFDGVHKGREISEETRRKMSEAQKGRTLTEESRKKLRDSVIKRWERYREAQNQSLQNLSPTW